MQKKSLYFNTDNASVWRIYNINDSDNSEWRDSFAPWIWHWLNNSHVLSQSLKVANSVRPWACHQIYPFDRTTLFTSFNLTFVKCPCSVFNAKCHYNLYFFNNNNNNNLYLNQNVKHTLQLYTASDATVLISDEWWKDNHRSINNFTLHQKCH